MGAELQIDDINTHTDLFFVVSGALEFTMREEKIMRVEKVDADEKSIDSDKQKEAELKSESFNSHSSSLEAKSEMRSLASSSRAASDSSLLDRKKRLNCIDNAKMAMLGQRTNESTMPMINI